LPQVVELEDKNAAREGGVVVRGGCGAFSVLEVRQARFEVTDL